MSDFNNNFLKKVFISSTVILLLVLSIIFKYIQKTRDKVLVIFLIISNLFNLLFLENKKIFEQIGHNLFGFSFIFIFLFSKSFNLTFLATVVLVYTLITRKIFKKCMFDFYPLEKEKEIKLIINSFLERISKPLTKEYNVDEFLKVIIILFILKCIYLKK
jgi:hypothetical protein